MTKTEHGDFDLDAAPVEALVGAVMAAGRPGSATAGETTLARFLVDRFGGLAGLSRATVAELEPWMAPGPTRRLRARASARALAAAFELGRRAARDEAPPPLITNSNDAAGWATPRLTMLDHEELWLLALDGRSRLRAARCVARGGLHGLGVRPADPLRLALRAAASGFVLVHNHPSGDPTPSAEDMRFTERVAAAAAVAGVPLLDHVVVARGGFSSVPFSAANVEA
ncbi:MAG: JAB domain-containing protein [Labilithrix sp.]|nr:JAB domain-containing protein [Labilithrix sp.]